MYELMCLSQNSTGTHDALCQSLGSTCLLSNMKGESVVLLEAQQSCFPGSAHLQPGSFAIREETLDKRFPKFAHELPGFLEVLRRF